MADVDRDSAMRMVGQLQAVHQSLELVNVPHEDKRTLDLVNSALVLLQKAVAAAWDTAANRGTGL